jgi:lipoprotein-anchoring transpeptidase ErfK/SrfK
MSPAFLRLLPCALGAVAFLSGCAGYSTSKPFFARNSIMDRLLPPSPPPAPESLPPPPAKRPENNWNEGSNSGASAIVVKLGEQRAYFYRGKKVVGSTRISTGKKGFGTPAGAYSVIQKDKDHVSTLYGEYVNASGEVVKSNVDVNKDPAPPGSKFRGAKMPYFLRFHEGHGLHAGRVPNYPASHGCVRLPAEMAKHFFENAEVGTPVTVVE